MQFAWICIRHDSTNGMEGITLCIGWCAWCCLLIISLYTFRSSQFLVFSFACLWLSIFLHPQFVECVSFPIQIQMRIVFVLWMLSPTFLRYFYLRCVAGLLVSMAIVVIAVAVISVDIYFIIFFSSQRVNLPNVNFLRATFARDVFLFLCSLVEFCFVPIPVVRVGDGIRINMSSIRSRPKAHQWRWCTFIGSSFIMIAYFCRRNAVSIVFLLRNSVWSTHHSHPAASSSPSPLVATPHINSSKRLIDTIWLNHVWRWLLVIYWLPSAFCRTPYSSAHWKVCCIDNCTRNTLCMSNRRNWSLLFYILSPFRACLALPHTSKQYSIEFRVRIKIERSSWFARNFGKNKTFFYCSPVVLSDRALLTADGELNAVCAYSHLL